MAEIVIATLLCGQETVEHRANSAEVYGYDFCFDDQLGVWLIEINASPAWDYSSAVTERLVKLASEDYIKLVVDEANNLNVPFEGESPRRVGQFEQIYHSRGVAHKGKATVNLDLKVVGVHVALASSVLK